MRAPVPPVRLSKLSPSVTHIIYLLSLIKGLEKMTSALRSLNQCDRTRRGDVGTRTESAAKQQYFLFASSQAVGVSLSSLHSAQPDSRPSLRLNIVLFSFFRISYREISERPQCIQLNNAHSSTRSPTGSGAADKCCTKTARQSDRGGKILRNKPFSLFPSCNLKAGCEQNVECVVP